MIKTAVMLIIGFFAYCPAAELLKDLPSGISGKQKTFEAAFDKILNKHNWKKISEPLQVDTMGSMELNGTSVYVLDIYLESNLDIEEFYLIYDMNGYTYYHHLASAVKGKKVAYESFFISTWKYVYAQMSFSEKITKTGQEDPLEYVRMHVMAFGQDGGKFIAYGIPVKVPDPSNPLYHCFLTCDIKSDSKLVINKSGEANDPYQASFVGEYPIKY